MTDDDEFFAWLDGELDGDSAARVAARVASDPELAARAERHRKLASSMQAAFAPLLDEASAPPKFQSAEVVNFGARDNRRERQRAWLGVPQWAAMAATLALGLLAGSMIGGPSDSPVTVQDGRLMAAASLDRSLDSQLASAGVQGPIRVGLTFRNRQGAICRSFGGPVGSGLACRSGNDWQIEGLFAPHEEGTREYRMAAGVNPQLAALIDATIAGEPFDAEQEKAAHDKGWR